MKQKTLPAIIVILFLSFQTNAQIAKGSVWLGGSVGLSSYKRSSDNNPYHESRANWISPGIGKAIKENTILGLSLNYRYERTENYYNYLKRSAYSYGISPFIRQYIPVAGRLYIFGQGNAQMNLIRNKLIFSDLNTGNEKGWNAGIFVTPGISYAVHKKWHIEAGFNNLFGVGYNKMTELSSPGHEIKTESYYAGVSLDNASQLYLGFRLLLTK
jgi:hypothetical protein